MGNLHPSLKDILDSFDSSSKPFEYYELASAIQTVFNANSEKDFREDVSVIGEVIAFYFVEDYQGEGTGWGTYYGPFSVLPNGNGMFIENPSIQEVTPEMLGYWEARAKECRAPLLQNRYADLVWDFSKNVTGKGANIEMAQLVIDSAIEIAKSMLHEHETDLIKRLERALSVALSVNDASRVESVRDAIIALEDKIGSDAHPGTWGFSFDLLIDNKKVPLTGELKNKLLSDLENRLARLADLTQPGTGDVYSVEVGTQKLAEFYRKAGKPEDVRRVLQAYRDTVIKMSKIAGSLVGMAWLEKVHAVFFEFGMKAEAEALHGQMLETGKNSIGEMKEYSVEIPVPHEKIAKHIEAITSGSLEDALGWIASYYIPNKAHTVGQVREIAKKNPLGFLVTRTLVDYEGRPVAKIGPLHEDLDGHVIEHMSHSIGITSILLRPTIAKAMEKYQPSAEQIVSVLFASPVFSESKRQIVKEGVSAYLEGKAISAAHLLIPQIEESIRTLAKLISSSTLKRNRNGGLSLKTFDELLRDEGIFQVLGENAVFYFRVLFTDQRGWNLRNEVCHGLMHADRFTANVADRVFHALLLLSQIREKPE